MYTTQYKIKTYCDQTAGTALILTEGDSAKVCAVNGICVLGREKYGVYPLRGKVLNVMKASKRAILDNKEMTNLCKIVGLQIGRNYKHLKELRYQQVICLTDADSDGKHICGLLMAFFSHFWPEIIPMGFLSTFITPVVKAVKGANTLQWYNIADYMHWQKENQDTVHLYNIRYYKGLGTSSHEESKAYFREFKNNNKPFVWSPESKDAIDVMFSDKRIQDRKTWIANSTCDRGIDHTAPEFKVEQYINHEVMSFCQDDLRRSIPSVVDGLKVSQRKVIWAVMRRNLREFIKVSQLAGHVSEVSGYHHGEVSLAHAIIGLNQNFVGKNQLAYLEHHGNFGTRLRGGHDCASERYITTKLAPPTRVIFPKADDVNLKHCVDDGSAVEPEFYVPVIPTILINEIHGIGTGWSCYWPSFALPDIVSNVLNLLENQPLSPMAPFFHSFNGPVAQISDQSWELRGAYHFTQPLVVDITELPPHKWIDDYKDSLVETFSPIRVDSMGDVEKVHLRVHFNDEAQRDAWVKTTQSYRRDALGFREIITINNMHAYTPDGKVTLFKSPLEVISLHFALRYASYVSRKDSMHSEIRGKRSHLHAELQFITAVIGKRIDFTELRNLNDVRDRCAVVCPESLVDDRYKRFAELSQMSLTKERVAKLQAQVQVLDQKYELVQNLQPNVIWLYELSSLPDALLGPANVQRLQSRCTEFDTLFQ